MMSHASTRIFVFVVFVEVQLTLLKRDKQGTVQTVYRPAELNSRAPEATLAAELSFQCKAAGFALVVLMYDLV